MSNKDTGFAVQVIAGGLAAGALAFTLGMLAITGVEWISGGRISGGQGTTIGDIVRPPHGPASVHRQSETTQPSVPTTSAPPTSGAPTSSQPPTSGTTTTPSATTTTTSPPASTSQPPLSGTG